MTTQTHQLLYEDRFDRAELLAGEWTIMSLGDFSADDGVPVLSGDGLTLAPAARNPSTGEPAFTKAVDGFNGHLKYLALSTQTFSTTEGPLAITYRAAARTFGVAEHPFGEDAQGADDPRLGAAVLNVLDFSTGMVFDFWITEHTIVPFYERLRLPDSPGQHESFSSMAPAVPRSPETFSDLTLTLDGDTAAWLVDGAEVARVDRVGVPDSRWRRVLGHGGVPEAAHVSQVQLGFGLFTLLDATHGDPPRGLVDLGLHYEPRPSFHGGPPIWGQGAELRLARVSVERA